MGDEKRVKDIMSPIAEYTLVGKEASLKDALDLLGENYRKIRANDPGAYHKTLLVTGASGEIVGKLSMYDLIRGLVPEPVKEPAHSRAYYALLSSRTLEVADEVGEVQERFKWLHTSFADLVAQETRKKVGDVMSPVHPLVEETDTINKAVYIMFKEKIRQPLVVRSGKIVGVVNVMDVFNELLDIAVGAEG